MVVVTQVHAAIGADHHPGRGLFIVATTTSMTLFRAGRLDAVDSVEHPMTRSASPSRSSMPGSATRSGWAAAAPPARLKAGEALISAELSDHPRRRPAAAAGRGLRASRLQRSMLAWLPVEAGQVRDLLFELRPGGRRSSPRPGRGGPRRRDRRGLATAPRLTPAAPPTYLRRHQLQGQAASDNLLQHHQVLDLAVQRRDSRVRPQAVGQGVPLPCGPMSCSRYRSRRLLVSHVAPGWKFWTAMID